MFVCDPQLRASRRNYIAGNSLALLPESPFISSFSHCQSSRSPDLPLDILNTDLIAGLLIVIVPLALCQVHGFELSARWTSIFVVLGGILVTISFPISICLEFHKLQSSTIKHDDVRGVCATLCRICGVGRVCRGVLLGGMDVCGWYFDYICSVLTLSVVLA